jgi:hypothetical protein
MLWVRPTRTACEELQAARGVGLGALYATHWTTKFPLSRVASTVFAPPTVYVVC